MQRDGGLERKIVEQVKRNQDAMLDGILKIVSIDSTQSEAQENMPFGSGVDKALTETLALAKAMGFVVEKRRPLRGHREIRHEAGLGNRSALYRDLWTS